MQFNFVHLARILIVASLPTPYIGAATFNVADGDIASLRNAIATANSNGQDDVINLAANGTYLLSTVDPSSSTSGVPGIGRDIVEGVSYNLTINGSNATIARSDAVGVPEFRLMYAGGSVTVNEVTFKNGLLSDFGSDGGAIAAAGGLVLNDCTISNCSADGGGAIYQSGGRLVMNNCTVANNRALRSVGGGLRVTTAPLFGSGAQVTLTNCTFSGNSSPFRGGTIDNHRSTVSVINCTLVGGSVYNVGAVPQFYLANTILAGCRLEDKREFGTEPPVGYSSDGYNLSTDNGGGFLTHPQDQIYTDPKLDPVGLAFNGGPTQTIALTGGSPAIDRGHGSGVATDQRGFPRPVDLAAYPNASGGEASDIGAYEAGSEQLQGGKPSFVVTTLDDHDDGVAGAVDCTLREAIARYDALLEADVAAFRTAPTFIEFAPGLSGTLALDRNLGPLVVRNSVDIRGPGAQLLTISGGGTVRVFEFAGDPGISYSPNSLSGLTIRNGNHAGGNPSLKEGGAILYNSATEFRIADCAFVNNVASGDNGLFPAGNGGAARGGAISVAVPTLLTVTRCTFSGNRAFGGRGGNNSGQLTFGGHGATGRGGAIYSASFHPMVIENCTFDSNGAYGGGGGSGGLAGGAGANGEGAAIYGVREVWVESSTVAGNFCFGGAGGAGNGPANNGPSGIGRAALLSEDPNSRVANSIIALNTRDGNFASDLWGTFVSGGYNLIGATDGSTGFGAMGDQTGTVAAPLDPLLGPLGNNGGPTDTRLLLAGSPCVDAGKTNLVTDQRDFARPLDAPTLPNAPGGNGSDIGAVETDVVQTGPELVVTQDDDHDDGSCTFHDTTLREAVRHANAAAGPNTIRFLPGLSDTFLLGGGELLVSDSLTVAGPGAALVVVDAQHSNRILHVSNPAAVVSITGITFKRGQVTGGAMGGGILNLGNLTLDRCVVSDCRSTGAGLDGGTGGALRNAGTLTVIDTTLAGNTATGAFNGFGTSPAHGGGLSNGGTAEIIRCLFAGNTALGANFGSTAAGMGGQAFGGGVSNQGSLVVTNSTFSGNLARGGTGGLDPAFGSGGPGGESKGGGIFNQGQLNLTAATLALNTAQGGPGGGFGIFGGAAGMGTGGGIFLDSSGTGTLRGTLVAGNASSTAGRDVSGAIASGGFNLLGNNGGASGFTAAGDQAGTPGAPLDALLGPLQYNGGPTMTCTPQQGSPAIDRGKGFTLVIDQRGFPRPYDDPALTNPSGGDGSDIGAVELSPEPFIDPDSTQLTAETMQFTVHALPGQNVVVLVSSDLEIWATLESRLFGPGVTVWAFVDANRSTFARRFYRVERVP